MIDYFDYSDWIDSIEPEILRLNLDKITWDHTPLQVQYIQARNNLVISLYKLLALSEQFNGYAPDFEPEVLLKELDTLPLPGELDTERSDVKSEYLACLELGEQLKEAMGSKAVSKKAAITTWWIVHDNWGATQVDGKWVEPSEAEQERRLTVLLNRNRDAWVREPPSPELDAILAHFKSGSGSCPKCGSGQTKKFGKHRNGKQRYRCKDCGSTF